MVCKGRCAPYRAARFHRGVSRYGDDIKRCVTCAIYVKWEGVFCPCCHNKLRVSPRKKNLFPKVRY